MLKSPSNRFRFADICRTYILFLSLAVPLLICGSSAATTLNVSKGVVVQGAPAGKLVVRDTLNAAEASFTSGSATPSPGDWLGVLVLGSATATQFNSTVFEFAGGAALDLRGASATVSGISVRNTSGSGIRVTDGATPTLSGVYVTGNSVGLETAAGAHPQLQNSYLAGNQQGFLNNDTPTTILAAGNWWGHPSGPLDLSSLDGLFNPNGLGNPVTDGVNYLPWATAIPILGTSFSIAEGSSTEVREIMLNLTCLTCSDFRVSESAGFSGALFQPFAQTVPFQLSQIDGLKTVYVQFRTGTGNSGGTTSAAIRLDTAGPALNVSAPQAGALITRPIAIPVTATDPAGVTKVEYYIDGQLASTDTTSAYSYLWDIRSVADGGHEIAVIAYDSMGHTTSDSRLVTVSKAPPAAPAITSPAPSSLNTKTISVSGTAEPFISVSLYNNSIFAGQVTASLAGTFQFSNVTLNEGGNNLTVAASDSVGASPMSPAVLLAVDTGPPLAPNLYNASAVAGGGVKLSWSPDPNEMPAKYRLYRSTSSFSAPSPALLINGTITATTTADAPAPDGTHYYGVTALDGAGNESPLSAVVSVQSDSTPPTAAVQFTPASPVGPGTVAVSLLLSEALSAPPYLGISAGGDAASVVVLNRLTDTEWVGSYPVTSLTPTGIASVIFSGKDLTGNKGTLITSGSTLLIDTKGPSAALGIAPPSGPYKTGTITVSVVLDEVAPQPPTLQFTPPTGTAVPVPLSGSGLSWSGPLEITSGMGDGTGTFTLSAQDAFGNSGSTITFGKAIGLDVTAPVAPTGVAAAPAAAGTVKLTWGAVADAVSYSVYRVDSGFTITLPATPLASGLTNGTFNDSTPTDSGYRYAVTALDRAGNESPLSASVTATSDRIPPAAPSELGSAIAGTTVNLSWNAPAGETAAGYNLYRATAAITTTTGLTPVKKGIATLSTSDLPAEDDTYHYAVTALDAAGNESIPSNDSSILYNLSPPAITIAGIADGQHRPDTVTPLITIKSASLASQIILLNGQPYSSGTPVTAEGPHLLHIEASDSQARTTVKELAFTIDLSDPQVTISGVSDGGSYQSDVAATIVISDSNPGTPTITLNGSPYVSGTPITSDGSKTLHVVARDLAGRTKDVTVTFSVDTAPPLPATLTVTATQGGAVLLEWPAAAAADVAGYHIYKNSVKLTPTPLSALSYSDTLFDDTLLNEYQLVVVDSNGHQRGPLAASIPPVRLVLKDYGKPLATGFMLNKQFIENIKVDLVNGHSAAVAIGSLTYELLDHLGSIASGTQAGPLTLAAGATQTNNKILPVGNGIVDYRTYTVTLALPSDPPVTITKVASFNLETFDPGRKVEIFNDPLIKGVTAKVKLKIYNHGSVPIELLTASGDQPSADIYVLLKDRDGNTLAKGNLLQKGAGVINYAGGYTLAEVPSGGAFVTAPIEFIVPANVPDQVYLQGYVSKIYYRYSKPDQVTAGDFSGYTSVQIGNPAYFATVTPDKAAYDQNMPVILSGRAYDSATEAPVPNAPVKIGIGVKGFTRYLSATTDANGTYSIVFNPLSGEAGNYTLWATHPTVSDKPVQASFVIYGLGFDPRLVNLRMSKNSSFSMPVTLRNLGETELTGIQLNLSGGSGISGTLDTTGTAAALAGGAATTFRFTLNADIAAPDASSATVTVTTAEGVSRVLEINIDLLAALPTIVTDPGYLETAVNRNSSKVVTFRLKNVGYAPLQNIVIQPPALPWIGLLSGTILPNLEPGQSVDISVNFRPTATTTQGAHADKLVITSGNHVPYTLNLFPVVSSTNKGSIHFQVTDSLAKKVAGASVMLNHQLLGGVTLNGKTDINGELSFLDIVEGMYNYKVQAAGHENVVGTVEVLPEVVAPVDVFMNNVFVTFDWTVTPMTITDKYSIKLDATFETNVPAPVITIDPAYQKLELEIGSTYVGEYTVKNHGLVALDNVKIEMAGAPGLKVDVLITEIPRINAQETILIPYRITVNPFKSPEPVDGCSPLPTTVNVGGGYVCAAGVPTWTGVTGTMTIIPRERYDLLGLCDVGCDWCKCAPPPAQGLCACLKTMDPCTCLGVGAGDGAATVCGCVTGDSPVSCLVDAAANTIEEAIKDKILSYVPIIGQMKSALDSAKDIASCILCLLEALPPLPSGTVAHPSGGGGGYNYGGMGSVPGGGSGFSTVRVCR